jgi:hypothetical protein
MIRTHAAPRPLTSKIAPRASLRRSARARQRPALARSGATYHGVRTPRDGALVVRVGAGLARLLPLARDIEEHSTGLEWGYDGQGPMQLAIALLTDAIGDDAAVRLGRRFYERVTSVLPAAGWTLTRDDVREHARALLRGA